MAASTSSAPTRSESTTRRRLTPEERKQHLVELGLELFGESSYDQISTEDIAGRAGISRGLLFHYFANKRGYYVAVIREAARRLLEQSSAAAVGVVDVSAQGDPQRVQLDVFLAFVENNAGLFTLLMQGGVGVDLEVRQIVDETRRVLARRVAPDLTEGAGGARSHGLGAVERHGLGAVERHGLGAVERLAVSAWIGAAEAAAVEWADDRRRGVKTVTRSQLAELLLAMLPPSMGSRPPQNASSPPSTRKDP